MSNKKEELVYKWDFESISKEFADINNFQERDARLRRLTSKMGKSIYNLLKSLRTEVTIVFKKKQNLLTMKTKELKKVSLEKLVGKT